MKTSYKSANNINACYQMMPSCTACLLASTAAFLDDGAIISKFHETATANKVSV
jgi:hypothetical protein